MCEVHIFLVAISLKPQYYLFMARTNNIGDIKVYAGTTWPTLAGQSVRIMADAIVSATGEISYRCKRVNANGSVEGANFFIVESELS